MAKRHPALLRQKHNRQDPPSVRVGGQELIGGIARIQTQQPEATAGDQNAQTQGRGGGEAEKESDGGKNAHSQRDEVMAWIVGGNTREQEGSENRTQADGREHQAEQVLGRP